MIRLYAMIFVIALLGGAAYAAKYYYDTTQATIAQLRENNAKLEVANEENQATIQKMTEDAVRLNALTDQLNADLRKSEQYGDEFDAKMGAEAVLQMLKELDLESEITKLKQDLSETKSDAKIKRLTKRKAKTKTP